MANNYKVLYRKYRPASFDEVVGQKYSIEMLKHAVENNKISHAYIFTGPRGTGKTSTAKIFAKTINCENPLNGVPCGNCPSCKNINNTADIIEIDAASNNGVDEIRELINNVKIAPSFSKYKVYIIDEVHMLSQSAFNALLLTLEEPPSHIVFILATTNIESVPITILSRCQRYDFKKLTNEELIIHLNHIAKLENIVISADAIEEIAYLSEGGCRDALSILNQLSTSADEITLETVLQNYGSVSMIQIKNIVEYYVTNSYEQLKNTFDSLEKSSMDYKVFIKKLVDQLFEEAIKLKEKKKEEEYLHIKDIIFELNDLINKININVDPFVLIFLILVKNIRIDVSRETNLEPDEIKIESNVESENKISEENRNNVEKNRKQEEKIDSVVEKNESISFIQNQSYLDYLSQLQMARVNNCFAMADKSLLLASKEKWLNFNHSLDVTDDIKSIIIDSELVLASSSICIITDNQESIVNRFNKNLNQIEKKYKDLISESVHFIALTSVEWEKSKKEYIKKIKEKYVYQVVPEPTYEHVEMTDQTLENANKESDYTDVLAIFDEDHVQIK